MNYLFLQINRCLLVLTKIITTSLSSPIISPCCIFCISCEFVSLGYAFCEKFILNSIQEKTKIWRSNIIKFI